MASLPESRTNPPSSAPSRTDHWSVKPVWPVAGSGSGLMAQGGKLASRMAQTKSENDLVEVKEHRSTAPNAHVRSADSSEPQQSPPKKKFQRLSEAVAAQPDAPAFALLDGRPSEGFVALDALRRLLQIRVVIILLILVPWGAALPSFLPALVSDGAVLRQEETVDQDAIGPSIIRSPVDTLSWSSPTPIRSSASSTTHASAGNLTLEAAAAASDAKTARLDRLSSTLPSPAVVPLRNLIDASDQEVGTNTPSPEATAASTPEPERRTQDTAPLPASTPRVAAAASGGTDPYVAAHRLLRNGDLPGAEEALRRALHSRSPRASDYYDLGRVLQRQGKYDEAAKSYQAAIRLAPARAYVHYNLGVSLSRLDRLDEAALSFERAATLDSNNPYVFYDWGWTLERLGRLAEAREKYALTINKDGASNAATNARERLKILNQ
jgi:tetratricopeptide (TPR) repeat protein